MNISVIEPMENCYFFAATISIPSFYNLLSRLRLVQSGCNENIPAGTSETGLTPSSSVRVQHSLDDCLVNDLIRLIEEGGNEGQVSLRCRRGSLVDIKSSEHLLHAGGNLTLAGFVVLAGCLCSALPLEGVLLSLDGESSRCDHTAALWESCKRVTEQYDC